MLQLETKELPYCRDNDVVFFFLDTYPELQDNISRGSAEGTANQGECSSE